MNAEFHYYTVYYLALEAGFSSDDAYLVAYSSQYLDNAIVSYHVQTDSGVYETLVTHHFGFWDSSQEWEVWIPFHFFPAGDHTGASRRDHQSNRLNVVANSPAAKTMLIDALHSRNLYRVGCALHTYADTWAHQNFTGRNEKWNRVDRNTPIPPIGHAQVRRDPDRIDVKWSDPRLASEVRVNNRLRFMQAAGRVYRYLATYNRRSFKDEELVMGRLEQILGLPGRKTGEERIADFMIECSMDRFRRTDWRKEAFEYPETLLSAVTELDGAESAIDKINWLKDELLHRTKVLRRQTVKGNAGFYQSNLYRWDQAAREQLKAVRAQLKSMHLGG
jgi:hypothetical protein